MTNVIETTKFKVSHTHTQLRHGFSRIDGSQEVHQHSYLYQNSGVTFSKRERAADIQLGSIWGCFHRTFIRSLVLYQFKGHVECVSDVHGRVVDLDRKYMLR